ncbi:MAG: 4Fe-4S dicluster domain-containing protein, partial [Coriobacteriales bacterium]|nr:4Fe-4S dicluster domain-containing protein [Coriobacteriales bacterium]
ETMFDSPYWNDLSLKCLNCGTCTFVCPTCYCFDMSQNNRGNEGYRFRSWDSCMFTDYTLMAGNHNPRPTKMKRLRNRFMHKLSFFDSRYGSSLCSGCGRCIEMCPVGIDITRIIEDSEKVAGND